MAASIQILLNVRELFTRISQDDDAAFTEVFYHYTQRIYHYILGKTKSRLIAEEIVQEVFIKLWTNRDKLNAVLNPESYIFSMATNLVFDWLKKMANEEKVRKQVWVTLGNSSNTTFETLDLHNTQELVNKALEQLSPQRKKIFILSRQQGFTHAEIARQLNLSEKTVNNHLTESLRFIREYLERIPGVTKATLILILCICR